MLVCDGIVPQSLNSKYANRPSLHVHFDRNVIEQQSRAVCNDAKIHGIKGLQSLHFAARPRFVLVVRI